MEQVKMMIDTRKNRMTELALVEAEYDYLKEILLENIGGFQNAIIERYLKEEIDIQLLLKSMEITGQAVDTQNDYIIFCVSVDFSSCALSIEEFEVQSLTVFHYIEQHIFKQYEGWYFKSATNNLVCILKMGKL